MASSFPPIMGLSVVRVFLVFSLYCVNDPAHTKETKCKAIGNGSEATVTCLFPQNMNSSQLDFSVMHRGINSSKDNPVVSCNWQNTTNMKCTHQEGYTLRMEISNEFHVKIPQASSQTHDGNYSCIVVGPHDGKSPVPCTLNISGVPDAPSDIHIKNATLESVTICWKAPPNKKETLSYRVRFKMANSELQYRQVLVCPREATCYTIGGLTPGSGYKFSVQAGNKFGWSSYLDLPDIANTSGINAVDTVTVVTEASGSSDDAFLVPFVLVVILLVILAASVCFYCWYTKRKQGRLCSFTGMNSDSVAQQYKQAGETEVQINPNPYNSIRSGDVYTEHRRDPHYENVSELRPVVEGTEAETKAKTERSEQKNEEDDDEAKDLSTAGLLNEKEEESASQ